jgi:hypothetical protein
MTKVNADCQSWQENDFFFFFFFLYGPVDHSGTYNQESIVVTHSGRKEKKKKEKLHE